MKLLVGLGNPGDKYQRTRHNAGFWWVDALARITHATFHAERGFGGLVAKVSAPHEIWLLRPETFMNNSGRAVGALAAFYKIEPRHILVVHDELDLPAGGVKLKLGGGTSGHNGLKDIEASLGSREFWRLRLGIGHPRDNAESRQEVVDYVLHPPRAEEQKLIDDAIARSLELWPLLAEDQYEAAMLKLHTREKKTP